MRKSRLILCLLLIVQSAECLHFNFKKISCNSSDPSHVVVEKCILKAVARNRQFISIRGVNLKKPLRDLKVRIQFMKKANGWKPFLYDINLGCDFLKKRTPVTNLISVTLKETTNINHSCPFYEDLEVPKVENTYVSSKMLRNLPVPPGEYAVFYKLILEPKAKFSLKIYGEIF